MSFVFLAIAAIAGYWVYSDSRSRGHEFGSTLLWTLGTLVMPLVFLPLYLLLGRKTSMPSSRRDADIIDVEATPVEETSRCPMCAGRVKDEFKVCPYCAFTLKPKCEACGKELNREWKTCPYCNTPAAPK
ncbi:MAG: zinc ribbon domain-containing protein [Negativicutes bacterium]|nr:zinc ribbon domain-containing protein [Negativicutes bacterium]